MGGSDNPLSLKDGSLFHIGTNVSFAHVLAFLSILVFFIILLEHVLHLLEKKAARYRKYEEMLSKVYRELMVLGFIGLVIKIFKEISKVDSYSPNLIAFQVADLTIFILAVVLIFQAICVHVLLRRRHLLVDRAELISTTDLVEAMTLRQGTQELTSSHHTFHASPGVVQRIMNQYNTRAFEQMARLRVLRHLFLRRYGLPEMFPFSKYLRRAQDNQITNMIDVHASTWLLLIAIAWGLDGATDLVVVVGSSSECYALAVVLGIFAWTLVAIHMGVTWYLRHCVTMLLNAGGYTPNGKDTIPCLQSIAQDEVDTLSQELATDALEMMQRVQERQEIKERHHHEHFLAHDVGFQLVQSCFRYIRSFWTTTKKAPPHQEEREMADSNVSTSQSSQSSNPHRRRSTLLPVRIRWFSRKGWHFIVMLLLMLNAFYIALVCQCVLYQIKDMMSDIGILAMLCIPVPVVLNILVFQPKIFHNFMIVSSIFRVDVNTLSEVVTHFSEMVELRSGFACALLDGMRQKQKSISDLVNALERRDVKGTKVIEVEELRLVLRGFGFHLSHYRFNSVAKLLFQLKGTKVEYAQVLRLVALAEADLHNVGPLPPVSSHVLLRQSTLTTDDEDLHEIQEDMDKELSCGQYVPPNVITGSTEVSQPLTSDSQRANIVRRPTSGFHRTTSSRAVYALYHIDSNVDDIDNSQVFVDV